MWAGCNAGTIGPCCRRPGSFSIVDGNGSKNVEFTFFLNFIPCGTALKFRKRKKNSLSLLYVLHKLKIRYFHVVVVQWRQRNERKIVLHLQSCCFAQQTFCFFLVTSSLPSPSSLIKLPLKADTSQRRADGRRVYVFERLDFKEQERCYNNYLR